VQAVRVVQKSVSSEARWTVFDQVCGVKILAKFSTPLTPSAGYPRVGGGRVQPKVQGVEPVGLVSRVVCGVCNGWPFRPEAACAFPGVRRSLGASARLLIEGGRFQCRTCIRSEGSLPAYLRGANGLGRVALPHKTRSTFGSR
jgi:hypothetical protein